MTSSCYQSSSSTRPICIDFFAGAGGLSLGFEQAGFDIAAAVEIDPVHCATHEFNFPYSRVVCASVVNLSGKEIRTKAGLGKQDIDVVMGGAPCQGFSLIGKRALDDPRNHLVSHFVRLVAELQPKYFVFENVKGLTLGKHVNFLNELIEALDRAGYTIAKPYQVLNAADYGVPQDRRRLFVIGARKGLAVPQYPISLATKTTVQDAIGDLPNIEDFPDLLIRDSVPVTWKTTSRYGKEMRGLKTDPLNFGYLRQFDRSILSASTRTEHSELSQSRFLATEPGKTEPISRFRKLPLDGLCNTLRAGTDSARGAFTSPRPIHPIYPRVISVREAARLHSYPDWFRFHVTKWHGFRQIGNSVPPLLARAMGSVIMKALGVSPEMPNQPILRADEDLLSFDMSEAARYFQVPRNTIAQRNRKTSQGQEVLWSEAHA